MKNQVFWSNSENCSSFKQIHELGWTGHIDKKTAKTMWPWIFHMNSRLKMKQFGAMRWIHGIWGCAGYALYISCGDLSISKFNQNWLLCTWRQNRSAARVFIKWFCDLLHKQTETASDTRAGLVLNSFEFPLCWVPAKQLIITSDHTQFKRKKLFWPTLGLVANYYSWPTPICTTTVWRTQRHSFCWRRWPEDRCWRQPAWRAAIHQQNLQTSETHPPQTYIHTISLLTRNMMTCNIWQHWQHLPRPHVFESLPSPICTPQSSGYKLSSQKPKDMGRWSKHCWSTLKWT